MNKLDAYLCIMSSGIYYTLLIELAKRAVISVAIRLVLYVQIFLKMFLREKYFSKDLQLL